MLSKIQMMNLCALAHEHGDAWAAAETAYDPDLSVVWGPAWKSDGLKNVPYSFAYVVRSSSTGNYTIAIRGTTIRSLRAWIFEDFDISTTLPFAHFVPGAPPAALLSKGTANGLVDLLALRPESKFPGQGSSLVDFLKGLSDLSLLAVTGHSLGGTLTGPLFATLRAQLGAETEMDLMSFAGLTPGNQAFADHLDSLTPRSGWRVVNPLDVAPHFFSELDAVLHIYDSEKLLCGPVDTAILKKRFASAAVPYVQPGGDPSVLPRVFKKTKLWLVELAEQHGHNNYVKLVEQEAKA
jgi:hypothetical protein